jgi:hypothetical protein
MTPISALGLYCAEYPSQYKRQILERRVVILADLLELIRAGRIRVAVHVSAGEEGVLLSCEGEVSPEATEALTTWWAHLWACVSQRY